MNMNPFEELQQYQLGSSLMGQPQASTPAVQQPVPQLPMGGMPQAPAPAQAQGGVPPRDANELQQRTTGWMSALQELQANPAVAIALLQIGTALTGGKKFNTALGMGMGAMGRVGAVQNAYQKQGLAEGMANRKMGLEERELSAREKMWEAQTKNYERMAAGGGRGGGSGRSGTDLFGNLQKLENYFFQQNLKDIQDRQGSPPSEQQIAEARIAARRDAQYAGLGKSKIPTEPVQKDNSLDALKTILSNSVPGSPEYNNALDMLTSMAKGGGSSSLGAQGAAGVSPADELAARLRAGGGLPPAPGAQTQAPQRAPNAALGSLIPELEKMGYGPAEVLSAARNGTIDTWQKQGWNVKEVLDWAIGLGGLGAKEAVELRALKGKY